MTARVPALGALLGMFASALTAPAASVAPGGGAAILQDLRSFGTVATLLHVGAHPDDENTQLITYFARGRGYRTAYLSLTRGDGGQNEIGPEFDEKLGLARTQELLAARKLDGGRQFFTRAIDFGYSKSVAETLQFWDRKEVLGDVVRIYREFRPDVVVTRFSPNAGGTHGHHTASAVLALEAFKLAGDPTAYPEQLQQGLTVWQPKRIFWNGMGGRGGGPVAGPVVRVDIGGDDPVTGTPFGVIAARSRGMHITQGFAGFAARGSSGPNEQTFALLEGAPAESDLFDGVETSWSRIPRGAEIGKLAAEAIANFKVADPAASVPALLAIRMKLGTLPIDSVVDDKRVALDRILQAALGLKVETLADRAEVVPGETLKLQPRVELAQPGAKWVDFRVVYPKFAVGPGARLTPGNRALEVSVAVPSDAPLTQPYWLRQEGRSGIARVDNPKLIGSPEDAPTFPVEYVFEVGGQTLVVPDEPVHVSPGAKGERRRRVDVIPPVSLGFAADVSVFRPGAVKPVVVEMLAARAGAAGTLELELPAGWKAAPAQHAFRTSAPGEKQAFSFQVTAPPQASAERVTARAAIGGAKYATQRITIDYPHLPVLLLQPPARARLLSLEVATRGRNVGYLPGAGDDTAEALAQLGYAVRTLTGADLTPEALRGLDAVVIGVRAFNEREDLKPNLAGLFKYVESGGTVIAQYNRPSGGLVEPLGPYALSIAGSAPQLRVTDEKAPVTFLAPKHPALLAPNRIGPADFEGWVQERGAYFPSQWDEAHYTSLLAMSDPGEVPLRSSVLIAPHGKGHYVYTGLAFFRQLPAGVPGAYRLFANLVSLGQ